MMKSFLVAVNLLALTLPFLAAQVQYQEPACQKNDGRLYEQKKASHTPMRYLLNNIPLFQPNYYQRRPVVPMNSPYISFPHYAVNNLPYPYYAQIIVLGPYGQIPKWPALPNIFQPTTAHQTHQHPSFLATTPKKNQDEKAIPTINTSAAVEPTLVPATEEAAHVVEITETSSELVNTPETTVVPVTPTVA
ncbi:kappa-casein [Perognathus longimembris pacificus]|uniref:kappa-casein n=1 Tax=Perognathus longimembris pacificus TaxID=214514 RepID=UPI00201946B3|nr:kappa-casein [Perognathus longimembris pacificus]